MSLAVGMFVLSSLAIVYTYALYPLILMALARRGEKASLNSPCEATPTVSVIIPFHNEERWVASKLENTLSWDYPSDRLKVIAVSDGSTDRTTAILEQYKDRVHMVSYYPRRGKPTALNRGVGEARGEILVFTDANVLLHPNAIRAVVASYADPTVGGVSWNVALQPEGRQEPLGEGLYMRYERWLYALDSSIGTMVGADGACFSIRRALFSPLPSDTITDDFAIALEVVSQGKRVAYESEARGVEMVVPDVRAEFRRKVRMIAGGYQALWRYRRLLNPVRFFTVSFQLLSHKLMRWLVPLFLVSALLASLMATQYHPVWNLVLALQISFYVLAALGSLSVTMRRRMLVYLPYYFCAVNAAAAVGIWRFLLGRRVITWQKVSR